MSNVIRTLIIFSIIYIILFQLPFINQAFHIDDTNFIYISRQIQKDPLKPYSFEINWLGQWDLAFDILANPPLISYYMAFLSLLFSESEIIFHLFFIVFDLITIFSMWFLSKKFLKHSIGPTLILVTTPFYLVMSHTVMPDTALLAFYLSSITCFIYGYEKNNYKLLCLSGILAGLAILTRYTAITIIPLMLLYSFLKKYKLSIKKSVVFIPLLFVVLWYVHNIFFYNRSHMFTAAAFENPFVFEKLKEFFIINMSYVGVGTIIPILFFFMYFKKHKVETYLSLITSLTFLSMLNFKFKIYIEHLFVNIVYVLFAFFAIYSVVFLLVFSFKRYFKNITSVKEKINFFLTLWILGTLCFNSTPLFVSSKYNLPLLPPLIILFYRLSYKKISSKLVKYGLPALVLVLGLVVSSADFITANAYRDFSESINYPVNKTYFAGHWGLQYYLGEKGYTPMIHFQNFSNGDIVIHPFFPDPQRMGSLKSAKLIKQYNLTTSYPIRTLSCNIPFNFYSNFPCWHNDNLKNSWIPFGVSSEDLDFIKVYSVKN